MPTNNEETTMNIPSANWPGPGLTLSLTLLACFGAESRRRQASRNTARCSPTAIRPNCSKPRAKTCGKASARPEERLARACDLGKGPGVVKGVFVELPRYFADTNKVQDLESRLLTCMDTAAGPERRRDCQDRLSARVSRTT
jgi:hypothetical protein